MRKILITFLLSFLVVLWLDADALLVSKVYAEDGYHCGKVIDVQTSFEAGDQFSILIVAATLIDNDFRFEASGWPSSIERATDQAYIRRAVLHRARDGLHQGLGTEANDATTKEGSENLYNSKKERTPRDGLTKDLTIWLC